MRAQDQPLEAQVARLLERNQEFEQRLEALESSQSKRGLGMGAEYGDVSAKFQLFGDVGGVYQSPDVQDNANTVFSQGSATFFATASMGENFKVLAETVLHGSNSASQERLWGTWSWGDEFQAKFGTEHSNISRWNQLNHHGAWLETTIERPYLARFEGDSGFLPMHRTGIELSGTVAPDCGRFEYFGSVSNGRGTDPTDKQRATDVDDAKQIEIGLAYMPDFVHGLRIGAAAQLNDIPKDSASTDPLRASSMGETVATVHLQYGIERIEIISEAAWVWHEARANDQGFDHSAAYLQLGYSLGDWTPYLRIDSRNMRRGDPFYSPKDRDLDAWQQLLGVRYELAENAAVKFEYSLGQEELRDSGGSVSEENVFRFAAQLAWWL